MSSVCADLSVREQTEAGIRRAAEALRDFAAEAADLRVSACDNIASETFVCSPYWRKLNEQCFGWSEESEQWWMTKGVTFFSPATLGARYESEPFWCNRNAFYTQTHNPALSSVDLSKIERFTGRKAVLVVPVHLPFGRIAAVIFHPNDRDCEDLAAAFADHADTLEQLSRNFIINYIRSAESPSLAPAYGLLNPREVECLQWAAGGKTDSEIAQIIARSHATIRFHVRSAMEKLDAVNRSQAIFKAAQLGYLARSSMRSSSGSKI